MILIADSGSTKADWALIGAHGAVAHTSGISPVHQSDDDIRRVLRRELLAQLPSADGVTDVYFYGSGVTPDRREGMARLLGETFPEAVRIEAQSDLLGAARALCGHNEGIACILGTGSNSCLYDGTAIVGNTPALGYILGDEGSGAVLGRTLLRQMYKGILPPAVKTAFEREYGLTMADVINAVYRRPLPNRFLASLAPFIRRMALEEPRVREMVVGCFSEFFAANIATYGRRDLPVHFVGSIAHFFSDELRSAARAMQMSVGTILRAPLEALCRYHG